jgi:hypothetical protein
MKAEELAAPQERCWRNIAWVLKKSLFRETATISGIENVQEN